RLGERRKWVKRVQVEDARVGRAGQVRAVVRSGCLLQSTQVEEFLGGVSRVLRRGQAALEQVEVEDSRVVRGRRDGRSRRPGGPARNRAGLSRGHGVGRWPLPLGAGQVRWDGFGHESSLSAGTPAGREEAFALPISVPKVTN